MTPTRTVWNPLWYVWAAAGVAALAITHELAPGRLRGHWLIVTPILILVGVLVIRRLWDLPPAATMCAAIVLTVFSGAWRQMGLGNLPFDRLLIVVVVLQMLLRAPGTAHTPRLQVRNVHLLMCLTIMYVLASAVAAGTITTETGTLTLLDEFGAVPFLMFLLAPAVFAGRRERNLLLATLVGLGAYLGFTAIFQSLGPHALVFPRYILTFNSEVSAGRASGPFQGVVVEGFATFACAVAAAIAFAQWREQRRRYLAAVVIAACVFGCFLTFERGVWIAAAVATVVTALATRTGRRWLIPGLLACGIAIGGALVGSSALASKATTRVEDQVSVWDRENQTSAGLRMVAAKPLFGFGWESYTSDSLEYFRQTPTYPMDGYSEANYETIGPLLPLHDTYLSYAVELGLVGALLWMASLLCGVGGAILSRGPGDLRPWKLGLIALFSFYLVVSLFNPYQASPFLVLLLWVWGGVAQGGPSLSAQARRAKLAREMKTGVAWIPA
jgi:putative inorganic carbon (hco3(-)) transporter